MVTDMNILNREIWILTSKQVANTRNECRLKKLNVLWKFFGVENKFPEVALK